MKISLYQFNHVSVHPVKYTYSQSHVTQKHKFISIMLFKMHLPQQAQVHYELRGSNAQHQLSRFLNTLFLQVPLELNKNYSFIIFPSQYAITSSRY